MNRSVLSAALLVTLSGGLALAQQQTAPPPPDGQAPPPHSFHHKPNPQREANRIAKQLNLTPDQAAKLEPIFANRDQQMQAIHSNGQLTQEAARQQMRDLMKSTQDQLATVLTPDQLQQLKQMRRGPHGGPRGQWQGTPSAQPQGI
jgi:Spy/CpxP family protein refolding chaperone